MSKHSIAPFPADIDRDYFGAWLSGFVDGEGCFRLIIDPTVNPPKASAQFLLSLRADDVEVLKTVQSFLKCGMIYEDRRSYSVHSQSPAAQFRINRVAHLQNIVIPHFVKYPLLAKKRHDFEIFKEGICLLAAINKRYRHTLSTHKWTSAERTRFSGLVEALKDQRKFKAPPVPLLPQTDDFPPLFDIT